MLRLIQILMVIKCGQIGLNTSHVRLILDIKDIKEEVDERLNTSHVKVNLGVAAIYGPGEKSLNTSHVKVN